MRIIEKLRIIKENIPKLYGAGKKAQDQDMWNAYQKNGNRTDYAYAFAGAAWDSASFAPRHAIIPEDADSMFHHHNNPLFGEAETENGPAPYDLKAHLDRIGVTLDFSHCQSMFNCFYCANITHIGTIDFSGIQGGMEKGETVTENGVTKTIWHLLGRDKWRDCFAGTHLQTIDKLIFHDNHPAFTHYFFPDSLVEIGEIEGQIHWPFYLCHCPHVSHDTILRFFHALADKRNDKFNNSIMNYYKIVLGAANFAKLTAAEIAIATGKGWLVIGESETAANA